MLGKSQGRIPLVVGRHLFWVVEGKLTRQQGEENQSRQQDGQMKGTDMGDPVYLVQSAYERARHFRLDRETGHNMS